MLGILALGALTSILIGLGWTWPVARSGLAWGLIVAGGLYLISNMWGASQLRLNQTQELWNSTPATGQLDLMLHSLRVLSRWHEVGFPAQIDVILTDPAPSLRWALRDYQNLTLQVEPAIGELPSVIITTRRQEVPALTAAAEARISIGGCGLDGSARCRRTPTAGWLFGTHQSCPTRSSCGPGLISSPAAHSTAPGTPQP